MNNLNITHDSNAHVFKTNVEGGDAKLDYVQYGDRYIDYVSTFVPKESRDKGVATQLVEHAIDYARKNSLRVKATCPFVKTVLSHEPDHNALKYPTV